jgi:hypothetical protein
MENFTAAAILSIKRRTEEEEEGKVTKIEINEREEKKRKGEDERTTSVCNAERAHPVLGADCERVGLR